MTFRCHTQVRTKKNFLFFPCRVYLFLLWINPVWIRHLWRAHDSDVRSKRPPKLLTFCFATAALKMSSLALGSWHLGIRPWLTVHKEVARGGTLTPSLGYKYCGGKRDSMESNFIGWSNYELLSGQVMVGSHGPGI